MRIIRSGFLAFLVVATAGAAGAASRDEAIQDLRSRFVNIARVEETYTATPRNLRSTVPSPDQEDRALKKVPRDLLLEAIDRVVRDGTKEERSGGIGMYCALIYDRELKPNQEYYPLFLDLLVKDDGSSDYYTFILVNALHWHPTRETVLAYVDVAERSRNSSLRYTALARASDMMGMDLAVYNNVPEEQNEKAMSDFVSWVRRDKDRIRFSKRGHFRLAGGEVSEDIEVLREEDRARIRKGPLRTFNRLRDLARPGLKRAEDRRFLLSAYYAPGPVPPVVPFVHAALKRRIVAWDRLKKVLRPWRR